MPLPELFSQLAAGFRHPAPYYLFLLFFPHKWSLSGFLSSSLKPCKLAQSPSLAQSFVSSWVAKKIQPILTGSRFPPLGVVEASYRSHALRKENRKLWPTHQWKELCGKDCSRAFWSHFTMRRQCPPPCCKLALQTYSNTGGQHKRFRPRGANFRPHGTVSLTTWCRWLIIGARLKYGLEGKSSLIKNWHCSQEKKEKYDFAFEFASVCSNWTAPFSQLSSKTGLKWNSLQSLHFQLDAN